jgi:hypothetical protein
VTVGFLATLRRGATDGPEAGRDLPEQVRAGLPLRFEAIGEALASGSSSLEACDVVGRRLAEDGAALDEVLDALRQTTRAVLGTDPAYDAVRAISIAWSEGTLAYLHQLSCEDPLTGLASMAHVRSRISEIYRGAARAGTDVSVQHALVVIDLPETVTSLAAPDAGFSRTLRLARVGQSAGTVFNGAETIGRLGARRVVAVVERDPHLGRRVALVRTLLASADFPTRVWIEGLPGSDEVAALLLDELAR